ncbi:MAG: 30S ribosomal protein S27e [Candidatus Micrarchaeia archaeon]
MDKKSSRSKYFLVKCDCGNEQNVFGNVKSEVRCLICKKVLAKPTGGKSIIFGKIVKVVGR